MVGIAAANQIYKKCLELNKSGVKGRPMIRELVPLKTWGWMLGDKEYAKLKALLRLHASAVAKQGGVEELCDDEEVTAIVAHQAGSTSASSSFAKAPASKKLKAQEKEKDDRRAHMRRIFGK